MGEQSEKQAKEFLVVGIPENAAPGATLRLLAIESSLSAAEKSVMALDGGTLGKVALLERRKLFMRRPAVNSTEIEEPILPPGKSGA